MTPEVVRFRVGSLPCFVLADTSRTVTEEQISHMFAKNAEQMLAAFRALPAPLGWSMNILLVEVAGKRVLIDTGIGPANPASPGHLLANLRAEGIAPESIDTIIITHYHMDHVGGLLDTSGHPVFAWARLVVPRPEHEYWMCEEVLSGMDPNRAGQLRQVFAAYASNLVLIDDTAAQAGDDIEPGIRYVSTPGHTPGHHAVSIESQGARLLHLADLVHMPLQLNAVEVSPSFDAQPDLASTSRSTALERLASENLLVMFYHFPFPGIGYIQGTGDAWTWKPYEIPPR